MPNNNMFGMFLNFGNLHDVCVKENVQFLINMKGDQMTIQLNKKINGSKRSRKYTIPANQIATLTPLNLNMWIMDINTSLF